MRNALSSAEPVSGPPFHERAERHGLGSLRDFLNEADVSEVCVNADGGVFVERAGRMTSARVKVDTARLHSLASSLANLSKEPLTGSFFSGTLSAGERVQFVLPPVTSAVVLCVRRQVRNDWTLQALEEAGAFDRAGMAPRGAREAVQLETRSVEFLASSVKRRKNILIGGGTSTGKTSWLNALLRRSDCYDRLVTIEDAREVSAGHLNQVNMVLPRAQFDEALIASLRLRPDRLIVQEVRGAEIVTLLRALLSGHPGSMSTIHAQSPSAALEQAALMGANSGLGAPAIKTMMRQAFDVYVQLARHGNHRYVQQVERWD